MIHCWKCYYTVNYNKFYSESHWDNNRSIKVIEFNGNSQTKYKKNNKFINDVFVYIANFIRYNLKQ